MINLKNIKSLLLAGVMAATAFSCTNLDEEIYSQVTADNFFQTPEEFDAAVVSAYTSLYGFAGHNGIWSIQEVSSDEMAITQKGGDWFDGGQWLRMHRHEFTDKEEAINNTWNFVFGVIANTNRLLEQFETIEGSEAVIAELRTLRAMSYYWLLDIYGNVPIVTKFSGGDAEPATNSRMEVYTFVETELLAGLADLPTAKNYSKINLDVANAILAKLYINAEVYTGTQQWQKAADAVAAITLSGNYSLESNYFANFDANNIASGENIFVIPYDEVFATGFNLPMMTLHYGSQATFNLTAQPWNGYSTLQDFYNSYDVSDSRIGNFLVGPQYDTNGQPIIDDSAEDSDPDGKHVTFTPAINELEPNALRQAGARVQKYKYELGATDNLNNDYPMYRYGDMLLIRAEALWRINPGDAEALTLVNDIRARAGAGLPAFTSLDEDNLLAERGREVFAEAYRRQDLIRFGKFNGPWWEKSASDAHFNIFPIPDAQMLSNQNLVQNPGY